MAIIQTLNSKKTTDEKIYQFKIYLIDTDVWRVIQVPDTYTFYDLHVAIQNAMGWTDSHLHSFEIKDKGNHVIRIDNPYPNEFEEGEPLIDTEVYIKDYLTIKKRIALYEYDFGDCWTHQVYLEKIMDKAEGEKYPKCIDGHLSCPPEDCGGIGGYYDLVELVKLAHDLKINFKKLENEDYQEELEGLDEDINIDTLLWLDGWQPDKFSLKSVKFENPRKRLKETLEL